jgi:FKBP-type peptidyl-prolyl cis-trans isomerase FkpA
MKIRYIGLIILLAVFACKRTNEKRTASGMKYILHAHKEGKKPAEKDYVTVKMVYTDENDSVLYDTRVGGKPVRFQLSNSPFAGSLEEGLMELSVGDSATLFVSADSMYEKVWSKEPNNIMQKPKQGSFLKFYIKLMRVQTYNEAELEMALNESHQIEAEQKALESYFREKNISPAMQPEGYYIISQSEGKGQPIEQGALVQVNYRGTFLNGGVFDSNAKSGKPYSFTVGGNEVITGWDLAFKKLKAGDRVTLIIPSKLAYGAEGLRNLNMTTYRVPPFSTLVFDIEVVNAKSIAKK